MITINFKRADKRSSQIQLSPLPAPLRIVRSLCPHCKFSKVLFCYPVEKARDTTHSSQYTSLWTWFPCITKVLQLITDIWTKFNICNASAFKCDKHTLNFGCCSPLRTLVSWATKNALKVICRDTGPPDHRKAQGRHHNLGNKRFGFFGEISLERYLTDVSKSTATRTRKPRNMKENIHIFSNCQSENLSCFLLRTRSIRKTWTVSAVTRGTTEEAFGGVG